MWIAFNWSLTLQIFLVPLFTWPIVTVNLIKILLDRKTAYRKFQYLILLCRINWPHCCFDQPINTYWLINTEDLLGNPLKIIIMYQATKTMLFNDMLFNWWHILNGQRSQHHSMTYFPESWEEKSYSILIVRKIIKQCKKSKCPQPICTQPLQF